MENRSGAGWCGPASSGPADGWPAAILAWAADNDLRWVAHRGRPAARHDGYRTCGHSTYGLRPAVPDAARILDRAGHHVIVPDLYGTPVASPVEGLALRDRIGLPELHARARRAAHGVGTRLVYAGFSLGAWLAQQLANDDPKARGLLMLHGMSEPPRQRRARPLQVQLHLAHVDVRQMPQLRLWQPAYG